MTPSVIKKRKSTLRSIGILTPILLSTVFVSTLAWGASAETANSVSEKSSSESKTVKSDRYQKLSRYLDTLAKHDKLMASVAIRENGQVVYSHQTGFISVEEGLKPNSQTNYQIGSISKTYTAVLALQLVEEGKLSLDKKLSEFYPEIPNSKEISIKNLLNHTSGLFNFTNDPAYINFMESPKSKSEMLELVASYPTNFSAGEKFEYSNSNYVLLSFILEDVSKKSYANLLNDKIIKPLGVQNTYVGDELELNKNEALSYQYLGDWQVATETDLSIPLGAGAISSTAEDVSAFMHGLFNGKLISQQSLKVMKGNGQYGYGLMSFPFNDKKAFGHNGGIDGFVSNTAYFESDNLAVSVLANGVNMSFNKALIGILSDQFGVDYSIPDFAAETRFTQTTKNAVYVGDYSSKQIPLKIKVFEQGGQLMAQASGQGAFPLAAKSEHVFGFEAAQLVMVFSPANNSFVLKQGGGEFTFTKE